MCEHQSSVRSYAISILPLSDCWTTSFELHRPVCDWYGVSNHPKVFRDRRLSDKRVVTLEASIQAVNTLHEQYVRNVIRLLTDLCGVEEVAAIHGPVSALLDEHDLKLVPVLADQIWPELHHLLCPDSTVNLQQ